MDSQATMTKTRALLWLSLGVLSSGCIIGAGGPCVNDDLCPKRFHCAQVQVCTRSCVIAEDCRVACDGGCGVFEQCVNGVCENSAKQVCVDGYCQNPCAPNCGYDPYGPGSRR